MNEFLSEIKKRITSEEDFTPNEKDSTEQNAGISEQVTSEGSSQNGKKAASNDKFALLDSLRHPFDTHKKIKKTEFIGGLYPRGYTSLIVGASGVGKTVFMQKNFDDFSKGGSFFGGFSTLDKSVKSLVLAAEFGENGLIERAQEFNMHSNSDYVEVIDVLDFVEKGIFFTLNDKEGQENIEHLAASNIDILFIDSFRAFYKGKETDNDKVTEVFMWLAGIARKYNIAVVVIHHNRKRLSSEQEKPLVLDDIIGGQALQCYVYRVIAIEYKKEHNMNFVTCLKSWKIYFKTFAYKVRTDLYGNPYITIDLNPEEITVEKLNAKGKTQASEAEIRRGKIIMFLKGRGNQGASISEITDALDMDKEDNGKLKMQLNRMLKDGELTQPKRGNYALPPEEIPQVKSEDNNEQETNQKEIDFTE